MMLKTNQIKLVGAFEEENQRKIDKTGEIHTKMETIRTNELKNLFFMNSTFISHQILFSSFIELRTLSQNYLFDI